MRWMKSALLLAVLLAVGVVAAQDDPATEAAPVTAQTFRAVNVRSGPGTEYEVVGQLNQGDVVIVSGRSSATSDWLLVELDGSRTGWAAFFTVTITGDPGVLPIINPDEAQVTDADDFAAQVLPPAPAVPTSPVGSEPFVRAYRSVNIRSGPSTNYAILGVLAAGETAPITGVGGSDTQWLRIDFDGRDGWVAFYVVNVVGDVENVPPVSASAASTIPGQVAVLTRFNTNLREEPRMDARVVAVVPYETELIVAARSADSAWLRVDYNGQTGWLIASLLTIIDGDISALPVP